MKKEEVKQQEVKNDEKTDEQRETEKFVFELNQLQEKYKRTLYAVDIVNEKGEIGPIIKIMVNK